jgi:hypothetical protein
MAKFETKEVFSASEEQIASLPQNVKKAKVAPKIKDVSSASSFISVLNTALERLMPLKVAPLAVVASPNRFDDVYWHEYLAVSAGDFSIKTDDLSDTEKGHYQKQIRKAEGAGRVASEILNQLETSKWRLLFQETYGLPWDDEVLALVVQDGLPWLVYSSSNNTDLNHVFKLWGKDALSYFGECEDRFDQNMDDGDPTPLRFKTEPSFDSRPAQSL